MIDKNNERLVDKERNIAGPGADSCQAGEKNFEIHVKGHLDRCWSEWLEGLEVQYLKNGEMILHGPIIDQAALLGVLNKLSRLNLTLISLNEVNDKRSKGDKMNDTQTTNRNFEAIAWGALFIWWGITELVPSLPDGTGAIGIGLILIGVNAARLLNGIPISRFSMTLGILALVWGGLKLVGVLLSLPFDIPVFAILLIVLGVILLGRALAENRNQ
jgi:hypothetical protein